jgi:hypothetical protein
MSTPFTLSGTLQLPPDLGVPNTNIPFSTSSGFDSRSEAEYNFVGAGTKVVDFGTITSPGAKAILIEVDPNATATPVLVQFNGGGAPGQVEIAPGGFIAYANPVPLTGITSVSIVYSTNVRVRIRLLG